MRIVGRHLLSYQCSRIVSVCCNNGFYQIQIIVDYRSVYINNRNILLMDLLQALSDSRRVNRNYKYRIEILVGHIGHLG